jgi:serine/threonine protein phosphatase PrpC
VEWASVSRRGRRGGANEDAVLARPPHFFGVADGVGSGSHGEVASQVALRHCAEARDFRPEALVRQVWDADAAVASALASVSGRPGATTLVALWLRGRSARLLHVGDARGLLFRRDWRGHWRVMWRTADQTYAALGERPPQSGDASDPCRMIGTGAVGEPALKRFTLGRRDLVLLCSDGLHRHVPASVMAGMVSAALGAGLGLDVLARRLVSQAAGSGSTDDITVLLLRRAPSSRPWLWLALAALAAVVLWALLIRPGFP